MHVRHYPLLKNRQKLELCLHLCLQVCPSSLDLWGEEMPFKTIRVVLCRKCVRVRVSVSVSVVLRVCMEKSRDVTPGQFLDLAEWQLSPAPGCRGAINMSTPEPSVRSGRWLCLLSPCLDLFSLPLFSVRGPDIFKAFMFFPICPQQTDDRSRRLTAGVRTGCN